VEFLRFIEFSEIHFLPDLSQIIIIVSAHIYKYHLDQQTRYLNDHMKIDGGEAGRQGGREAGRQGGREARRRGGREAGRRCGAEPEGFQHE